MKLLPVAALLSAALLLPATADARVCHNSHGHGFHCHRMFKPRIKLHSRHPIKILRCRAHEGKLNKCK